MNLILTSDNLNEIRDGLNSSNNLIDYMKNMKLYEIKALFIPSYPNNEGSTDKFSLGQKEAFKKSGITVKDWSTLSFSNLKNLDDLLKSKFNNISRRTCPNTKLIFKRN